MNLLSRDGRRRYPDGASRGRALCSASFAAKQSSKNPSDDRAPYSGLSGLARL